MTKSIISHPKKHWNNTRLNILVAKFVTFYWMQSSLILYLLSKSSIQVSQISTIFWIFSFNKSTFLLFFHYFPSINGRPVYEIFLKPLRKIYTLGKLGFVYADRNSWIKSGLTILIQTLSIAFVRIISEPTYFVLS